MTAVPGPNVRRSRLHLPEYLDVRMGWSDGRLEVKRAKYRDSGVSRDCYIDEGYAFKLTTLAKALQTNIPEYEKAGALKDLVPRVYGQFHVEIQNYMPMHCLVMQAAEKTVDDQMEEWRKGPLDPGTAGLAIDLILRVLFFMVYMAGERQVACSDCYVGNVGIDQNKLYLIDWEGTSFAPHTRVYQRMKLAMIAFLKWLPGLHWKQAVNTPEEPERTWLRFYERLQALSLIHI